MAAGAGLQHCREVFRLAIQTKSGQLPATANAMGLQGVTTGMPLQADAYNADARDIQEGHVQALLAGILAGGTCTAAGALNITIPSGSTWYARQVWTLNADVTIGVAASVTTYVWGCSDGVIRQTTSGLPSGFDATTAVLLTTATATSSTASVSNTGQHIARQVDRSNRVVTDGPLKLDYANAVVDASNSALRIPSFSSDPSVPGTGTFIWFNSTSGQAKVSVNGTVQPAVPTQTIRFGSGAPSSGLGIQGDVYFNTATGDVYLKGSTSYALQMNTATA